MRRIIAGLCCAIVGLQLIIGVPALVYWGLAHVRDGNPAQTSPLSQTADFPAQELQPGQIDAILEARQRFGSVLENSALADPFESGQDNRDFALAVERFAAQPAQDASPDAKTDRDLAKPIP